MKQASALKLRRHSPIWAALAALLLLLVVQHQFEQHHFSLLIASAAVVGLAVWGWLVWRNPPHRDVLGALQPTPLDYVPARVGLAGLALVLASISWVNLHGNHFNSLSLWTWLAAIAVWMGAWLPWRRPQRTPITPAERRRRWLAALLVLAITAVGAWLRFYRLETMPNDMTQDHGWKLLDISNILAGNRPLFLPNNTGREPWQFYYIATLIRLFNLPLDFIALKFGNALIGTLTIPLFYIFGREVGGRKLGVIAAALYAIGKWPISTTRMGLRFPYATLPAVLVLIHLWRYARYGRRSDILLAGLWMGGGLYGYIGIRIVPLVIALVLVAVLFDRRRSGQRLNVLGHGLLVLVTTAIIFVPLGHFMVEFPDQFWYRVATRTTDEERSIAQSVCTDSIFKNADGSVNESLCKLGVFGYNNVRAFAAFNWVGDRSEVNHVSLDPFFDVMTGALLLLALPLIAWRLLRERSLRWWMLLIALPILLLTTTLSIAFPIENPSTSRTGVVMPVIFVLAAAPLALLCEWMLAGQPFARWRELPRSRFALTGTVLLALFALGLQQNFVRYFRDLDRQYRAFVPNTGEVASTIESFSDRGISRNNTYIFGWPYWLEMRNVSVHLGDIHWHETHALEEDAAIPLPQGGQPMLYVFNQHDDSHRRALLEMFPDGELTLQPTEIARKAFYTFYVPPNSVRRSSK